MGNFEKARKEKSKLRAALFGPSGSGKTFTALRIATGIAEALKTRIALIDSEHKTASKYADRFDFDVQDLEDQSVMGYCRAIREAVGHGVLIIDSMTHGWFELLTEVDRLARAKFKGNTWAAWSEGTPTQRHFVNTLLEFDGHIIATMRSKTEWSVHTEGGKVRPIRIGLAPEQGKGIEYEFDLLLELSPDHIANVIKDRTGKYQDELIEKPDEDFGKGLIAWLNDGATPKKPAERVARKKKQ